MVGGLWKEVSISPRGIVTIGEGRDQILDTLSFEEQRSIWELFDGFDTLAHYYGANDIPCSDFGRYNIKITRGSQSKEVVLDDCITRDIAESPAVIQLAMIVKTLDKLKNTISLRAKSRPPSF
jgi:hypothetical protein